MSLRAAPRRLIACLLNISEARDSGIVQQVASAALRVNHKVSDRSDTSQARLNGTEENNNGGCIQNIKASVLNIFRDYDYNRSVITIVSDPESIGESVTDACCTAFQLIDLRNHSGGHPRLGAVDLVPIHPICADVTLTECGAIAKSIADTVCSRVPGAAAFLFGFADQPRKRWLVQRRKEVQWYDGHHGSSYSGITQDVGATPGPRYGLTGIGSIPYVMNCNVTIGTQDVEFGRQIATAVRATSPGGLPGVQSMAFAHEGKVEIACNVEAIYINNSNDKRSSSLTSDQTRGSLSESTQGSSCANNTSDTMICSFGDCYHVPGYVLESRVRAMAAERNIETVGTSIIGFSPAEANKVATHALENNIEHFWKTRKARMM